MSQAEYSRRGIDGVSLAPAIAADGNGILRVATSIRSPLVWTGHFNLFFTSVRQFRYNLYRCSEQRGNRIGSDYDFIGHFAFFKQTTVSERNESTLIL